MKDRNRNPQEQSNEPKGRFHNIVKWILRVILILISAFVLIFIAMFVYYLIFPKENNSSAPEAEVEQTESNQTDKPENYIENLDIDQAEQKCRNQMMMLIGHFEREDMPAEEKIQFAQDTINTIMPEIQTLIYNMKEDSDNGGDYDYKNLYLANAYGSVRNMCDDMISYYQTGDETYKTEFYEEHDRILENLNKLKE